MQNNHKDFQYIKPMTPQIISAIALSVLAVVTVLGYRRECRLYNKAKLRQEYGNKIERKMKRLDNDLMELYIRNEYVDDDTMSAINEQNKEIEQMIEQYKRM